MDNKLILHISINSINTKLETTLSSFTPPCVPRTIPALRIIKVYTDDFHLTNIEIDERFYNTYREIGLNKDNHISKYLMSKFNQFKLSNVNYGNYSIDDVRSNGVRSGFGYRYQGSKALYVEEFFDFLRVENRDNILTNILDEKEN